MCSKWTLIYWLMRVRYGVQFVNSCLVFVQPSSLSCYIQYYIILNNDILEFNYKIILSVTNHSMISHQEHINGLVQDCSISSALAMEILQSCTKPLAWSVDHVSLAPYMVQIYSTDYHKSIINISILFMLPALKYIFIMLQCHKSCILNSSCGQKAG